jgi:BMFP domain-containing protein YqiC
LESIEIKDTLKKISTMGAELFSPSLMVILSRTRLEALEAKMAELEAKLNPPVE